MKGIKTVFLAAAHRTAWRPDHAPWPHHGAATAFRQPRRARWLALLGLLIAGLVTFPTLVQASCFLTVLGADPSLVSHIENDPKGAAALLQSQLDGAPTLSVPDAPRARRYALLMEADEGAGEIGAARTAATHGLAALASAADPELRRWLTLNGIRLLQLQGQIVRAADEYERASMNVPDEAPDMVCVLGDRGYLRYLAGRKIDATIDALRSYRLARSQGLVQVQLSAGQLLARLYSQFGLYDEALSLATEALAFYAQSSDMGRRSDAYLFRGDILMDKGDYPGAREDFMESQSLLVAVGDRFALSYTVQRLCQVAVKEGRIQDAIPQCDQALDLARSVNNPVSAKFVLAAQGRMAAMAGKNRAALARYDEALTDQGAGLPTRARAEVYRLRAQSLEKIGDMAGALRDTNYYLGVLDKDRASGGTEQVALLKVLFDAAGKEERLARAQAEARTAELTAARQRSLRDQIALAALLAIALVILAMWSSHRRRLAESSRRLAEQRLAAINGLTGGIAHEFNNLLGVLHQAIGLLAERPSVAQDAGAMDLLRQARQANQMCADITSQLTSSAQQQNLRPEAVDLASYFEDSRALLERGAGPAIHLRVDIHADIRPAWVDRRQLTAALLNLIANARDAMDGRGVLVIQASGTIDKAVRIDVIDRGSGMSPETLRRAAEPFYTTKEVGSGSGLGLSVVQGFVTQSGGSMNIVSVPNQGTTVTLFLPTCDATA